MRNKEKNVFFNKYIYYEKSAILKTTIKVFALFIYLIFFDNVHFINFFWSYK